MDYSVHIHHAWSIYKYFIYYSQIKLENMTEFCSCAGNFQTLISRRDLAVYLKTFRGIAQHFKMPLLLETVEFNIQMNPSLITWYRTYHTICWNLLKKMAYWYSDISEGLYLSTGSVLDEETLKALFLSADLLWCVLAQGLLLW